MVTLAVMLTGGFYFQNTPSWLGWTKQVSFINHAYTLLLKIQYPEGEFRCGPTATLFVEGEFRGGLEAVMNATAAGAGGDFSDNNHMCSINAAGLLTSFDLEAGVGVNVLALLALLAGMRGLTYFALRFLSLKP